MGDDSAFPLSSILNKHYNQHHFAFQFSSFCPIQFLLIGLFPQIFKNWHVIQTQTWYISEINTW